MLQADMKKKDNKIKRTRETETETERGTKKYSENKQRN